MRIFLTGDTHGNSLGELDFLNSGDFKELEKQNLTAEDVLIVLGDFGLIFNPVLNKEEFTWLNILSEKPWTTCFIDGNHENFDRLNSLPIEEKWGGKVGVVDFEYGNEKMTKPIYHLKRGQVFNFNGTKAFTMGGALSIDKANRTPYISWWPQEEINYSEISEAYVNLDKNDNKVDFILTHTCPSNEIDNIFGDKFSYGKDIDNVAKFLNVIKGSVSFGHWFFGHFHQNVTKGKFTCMYKGIKEISNTKTKKTYF